MRFIIGLAAVILPISASFAQQGQGQGTPVGSMFGSVLPMMLIMFVIIYFLMIRPEQRKQKQRQKMINEMKKGDKVLTTGGIYGVVSNVKNDIIVVKIAENTNIEVTKTAISSVITKESGAKEDSSKESK